MDKTAFNKLLVRAAFAFLAILCVVMAVATFLELYKGSDFAANNIYGAPWFSALWFVVAACGAAYLAWRKTYKHLLVGGLHFALLLILLGAFLTHLTAKQGYIHLRNGESTKAFLVKEKDAETSSELPFEITLSKFQVVSYPGTDVASDYKSLLLVKKPDGKTISASISMNNIFNDSGIRLYQASYDDDMNGSTLSVNYDPYGTPVTYTGYGLLFFCLIAWLFSKNGMMRKALRNQKTIGAAAFMLLFLPQMSSAQTQIVLPKKQAQEIGRLLMNYEGRIAPIETFADDFVKKLTDGKTTYKGLTSEQILTGWIFFPSRWEDEDIISLKSKKLQEFLELERYTSYTKIAAAISYRSPEEIQAVAGKKETEKLSEKLYLVYSLEQGELMKMFPYSNKGQVKWFTYLENLPANISKRDADLIHMSMTRIYGYILMQKPQLISDVVKEISAFQKSHGGNSLPSAAQQKCEHLLNSFPFTSLLFKTNLTAGLLALLFFIRKDSKKTRLGFVAISTLTNILLLGVIILRAIVAGRVPLSNGYETMIVLAWLIQIVSLIACRRLALLNSFGLIGSGFMLLVAYLQAADPKITPLMPVLSSPLLALHVSVIMMAYALLTLTFLTSVSALAAGKFSRKRETEERLTNFVKILLPPAMTTLGIGIFVGAIWANVSWGSYWSWDSKEVWSLITFIVYGWALHEGSFAKLRTAKFFNAYIVIAYLTVLMTYFGVNMILPGMHSYSGM